MTEMIRIARFDGDGIGPEIMHEAVKVIEAAQSVACLLYTSDAADE